MTGALVTDFSAQIHVPIMELPVFFILTGGSLVKSVRAAVLAEVTKGISLIAAAEVFTWEAQGARKRPL